MAAASSNVCSALSFLRIIRRLWKEESQLPKIAHTHTQPRNVKVFLHRFKSWHRQKKDDPSYRYLCHTAKTDNKKRKREWRCKGEAKEYTHTASAHTYTQRSDYKSPLYICIHKQNRWCNTRIICKSFFTSTVHGTRDAVAYTRQPKTRWESERERESVGENKMNQDDEGDNTE